MKPFIHFQQLKYIFIDFDGTLVDSIPLLFNNYMAFLKKYEKEGSLKEFESLMGPSIDEFVPILAKRYGLTAHLQDLLSAYKNGLAERYKKEAKIIEGAKEFIVYAHHLGINLALVTSSDYFLIKDCLDELLLTNDFKYIITGEKVHKTKPDPEIYQLALKICSVLPEEVLTIEDSFNGLLASLAAHLPTIAIKNPHLNQFPAQIMPVNHWNELTNLFRNEYG